MDKTRVSNMNFTKNNNPNPFRSSRLLYRAIESPQDDEIFHDLHKNPEIYKDADPNLPVPPCRRRTTFLRQYYQRAILGVLICVVNEGSDARETPVGTVSLSNTAGASMAYHRTADLIISIAPAYQNKGYGTEAMRWTLHWAFGKANLHRVTLKVTSYNKRAIEFYKRVGFRVESKEKESIWHDNEWHDMLGMGDMMFYNPIEHLSANTSQRYSILNGTINAESLIQIPIVDISSLLPRSSNTNENAQKVAIELLTKSCHEQGYVGIKGHGISPKTLAKAFDFYQKLFALSVEDKMKAPNPEGRTLYRGYSALGREKAYTTEDMEGMGEEKRKAARQIVNYKESFEVGSEDNKGDYNIWLLEEVLPGFRSFSIELYWELNKLCMLLLDAFCSGLGLTDMERASDHALHTGHNNQLRYLHYPPVSEK
ncbi:MAG: hypothetical protein GOMPHAMPRED_007761 [Gomphillus americanus]|uniref:N-acetyltransferase domain-containing protein n=1 Tax=Gomphillus americanus TaxID=1940652 RepID=A0A8H3IEA7_9LECA|nr:MAG: hypothetical protein GOMPHAMPRED_007761 [Gomphillus americanus]